MLSTQRPFSLILFGASGHLAKIKLYPALYVLALKKRLPQEYVVMGYARSDMNDNSFRALVEISVREDMPEVNERTLAEFLTHVHYQRGDYAVSENYVALADRLKQLEKGWDAPVRLAYLSVPPAVFGDVLRNLCDGGVHDHDRREDFRCIVEKPVGSDLRSFEKIRSTLTTCFSESEIFLLDHYLGKEAVRNIYYLRFSNPILERILKNTLIHHVEITAMENAGLEGRAGYFDNTGTFRDMAQSHLLMIGALLTMRLQGEEEFKESRKSALEYFYIPPASSMEEVILQGQYAASGDGKTAGYLDEEGIPSNSRTNTYVALKLRTRTSRWEGVPFYLRTGKWLHRKETRISIAFQEPHAVGKGATPNRLDIILQGEAGMRLHLQTKVGGTAPEFRPLILEDPLVCVGDCLPEHGLLLLEAIMGKQQWYLSFEEVRSAWRLLDPLQAYLDQPLSPLHTYAAGTIGPEAADAWMARDRMAWLS
jgi:glucose-6-phosphate 1-dehydrogenase